MMTTVKNYKISEKKDNVNMMETVKNRINIQYDK